jgi:hypothetical protein
MVGIDIIFGAEHTGPSADTVYRKLILCGDPWNPQSVGTNAPPEAFRIETSQRTRLLGLA